LSLEIGHEGRHGDTRPVSIRVVNAACMRVSFANMIDTHNNDDDYLFRVLEWFNYSYMNVEGFSYYNRIVLLATAYEIFCLEANLRIRSAWRNFNHRIEGLTPSGLYCAAKLSISNSAMSNAPLRSASLHDWKCCANGLSGRFVSNKPAFR
jgi:hypothetical protein